MAPHTIGTNLPMPGCITPIKTLYTIAPLAPAEMQPTLAGPDWTLAAYGHQSSTASGAQSLSQRLAASSKSQASNKLLSTTLQQPHPQQLPKIMTLGTSPIAPLVRKASVPALQQPNPQQIPKALNFNSRPVAAAVRGAPVPAVQQASREQVRKAESARQLKEAQAAAKDVASNRCSASHCVYAWCQHSAVLDDVAVHLMLHFYRCCSIHPDLCLYVLCASHPCVSGQPAVEAGLVCLPVVMSQCVFNR